MNHLSRTLIGLSFFLPQQVIAGQQITIGIAANFSAMSDNTSSPYTSYFRNAIVMAFDENRDLLQANGLKVRIKEFDYGDGGLKAISAANTAVNSDILAMIGYFLSSDALLAGPIFNKNKLLLLLPNASADRLETIGPFVRRTAFDDSYQGKILAEYAFRIQNIKRIGIIFAADCAYCTSLSTAFKRRFEALGGRVVVEKQVLLDDIGHDELPLSFAGKPIDAIFVPLYERAAATAISTLLDAGISPKIWLGGDGWGWGDSADLLYHILGTREFKGYAIAHWHYKVRTPKSKAFLAKYHHRYGKPPNVDAAVLAYDAAQLLIKGLITAKRLDREGILAAVEKIRTFEGATGKLVYPPGRRTPEVPAILLRFEKARPAAVERILVK